jgi:hypothetical protein
MHLRSQALWRDPLLRARSHSRRRRWSDLKSCWGWRAPSLEDALDDLQLLGEVVLGSHDEGAEREYICSVRPLALDIEEGLVIGAGSTPTSAVGYCLQQTLRLIAADVASGLSAISIFLEDR